MLLQRILLVLVAISVLVTTGCQAILLQHPLIDPKDAKAHPALYGIYCIENDAASKVQQFVHVGTAGKPYPDGMLRFTTVSHPEPQGGKLQVSNMIGFVEPWGNYLLLHIPLLKHEADEAPDFESWKAVWDPTEIDGYYLARLSIQKDRIDIAYMNSTFLQRAIENKSLTGTIGPRTTPPEEPSLRITAHPNELRTFLEKHIEGQFFLTDPNMQLKLRRLKP